MDIFEWDEETPVTANNLNEMQNVINDNIYQFVALGEEKTNDIWVNGKTIYRKVIYIPSLPNATSQDIQHNISNVDEIWCDMGNSFIKWDSSAGNSPFNYIGGTSFNAMIELRAFTTTKFTIDTHSTNRSSLSAYVTLRYTKN